MTDLTEQWKKGELPDGYYYCRLILNNMKPSIERCRAHCIPLGVSADRGEQVLAEVPDYVEWKQAQERISKLEKMQYSYTPEEWNMMLKTVNRTREENDNLKDLLKEIRGKIKTVYDMELRAFITSAVFTDDFVKKIDEVLNAK
jgi:hypothetical protein